MFVAIGWIVVLGSVIGSFVGVGGLADVAAARSRRLR